jgi:hypothetical protein
VDLGPAFETQPNGHLARCTRTLARIRDRQIMYENHGWGSQVDLLLFLEGWDKGAEFGFGRSCSARRVLDGSSPTLNENDGPANGAS